MATPTASSPAPKPRMARTLTSVSSCTTSGLSRGSDMSHSLGKLRIVQRQQRAAAQLIHKQAEPERAERYRKQHIEPVHVQPVGVKRGLGQPEQIDVPHHEKKRRYLCESLAPALRCSQQQNH